MSSTPLAYLSASTSRPPSPVIVPRGPLPPFPPGSYRVELPWTPPHVRDFLRGDAWGVTIPGAPWVPGASARHPERILSWFVDRYDRDFRRRYLEAYAGRGYTHLKRSYGDSCGPRERSRIPYTVDDGPPGNDLSLAQFVQSCLEVKRFVPYVQVVLGSKSFQPHHMTFEQWKAFVDPILDALFAVKAVDEIIPGWEWSLWNTAGDVTIRVFKHVGRRCHDAGVSCWMHFPPEYTSWYADGDPRGRFGFYDDLGDDVDGLNYQTGRYADDDPIVERRGQLWSIRDTQDRLVDSLWQFGVAGNRHKLRFDEDAASLMWDNDRPNEDDANLRGYLACCTVDDVKHTDAKVWGFNNGGRRPDGSAY